MRKMFLARLPEGEKNAQIYEIAAPNQYASAVLKEKHVELSSYLASYEPRGWEYDSVKTNPHSMARYRGLAAIERTPEAAANRVRLMFLAKKYAT